MVQLLSNLTFKGTMASKPSETNLKSIKEKLSTDEVKKLDTVLDRFEKTVEEQFPEDVNVHLKLSHDLLNSRVKLELKNDTSESTSSSFVIKDNLAFANLADNLKGLLGKFVGGQGFAPPQVTQATNFFNAE